MCNKHTQKIWGGTNLRKEKGGGVTANRGLKAGDHGKRSDGMALEDRGRRGGKMGRGTSQDICQHWCTFWMQAVYIDQVCDNDGHHLTGGIGDESRGQVWWGYITILSLHRYVAPGHKVDRRFVCMLAAELSGVWELRWNAKWFIYLHMVILQRTCHISGV